DGVRLRRSHGRVGCANSICLERTAHVDLATDSQTRVAARHLAPIDKERSRVCPRRQTLHASVRGAGRPFLQELAGDAAEVTRWIVVLVELALTFDHGRPP